ncbi:MAG: DinB family protein [Flavisolibacter sp.]
MDAEMQFLTEQLKDAFEGDPWFGRNVNALIGEVNEAIAFEKPNDQHSIVELLWHMINWREFTISRLKKDAKELHYFETNDWRALDHSDKSLWQQGLQRLRQTQSELLEIIQAQKDEMLDQNVEERNYNFRKLLNGILQHDIYHLGQIAYIKKMLENK